MNWNYDHHKTYAADQMRRAEEKRRARELKEASQSSNTRRR